DGQVLQSVDLVGKAIFWHAATGRGLTEDESSRHAADFLRRSRAHRYWVARGDGEAIFLLVHSQTPIARFPVRIDLDSVDGLAWAGMWGAQVYLLRLEGVAEGSVQGFD